MLYALLLLFLPFPSRSNSKLGSETQWLKSKLLGDMDVKGYHILEPYDEYAILCCQCDVRVATTRCLDETCDDSYCDRCFFNVHRRGKRNKHQREKIQMCAGCLEVFDLHVTATLMCQQCMVGYCVPCWEYYHYSALFVGFKTSKAGRSAREPGQIVPMRVVREREEARRKERLQKRALMALGPLGDKAAAEATAAANASRPNTARSHVSAVSATNAALAAAEAKVKAHDDAKAAHKDKEAKGEGGPGGPGSRPSTAGQGGSRPGTAKDGSRPGTAKGSEAGTGGAPGSRPSTRGGMLGMDPAVFGELEDSVALPRMPEAVTKKALALAGGGAGAGHTAEKAKGRFKLSKADRQALLAKGIDVGRGPSDDPDRDERLKTRTHSYTLIVAQCEECDRLAAKFQCDGVGCDGQLFCTSCVVRCHKRGKKKRHAPASVDQYWWPKRVQDVAAEKERRRAERAARIAAEKEKKRQALMGKAALTIQRAWRGRQGRRAGKEKMRQARLKRRMALLRVREDEIRNTRSYKWKKALGIQQELRSDTQEEKDAMAANRPGARYEKFVTGAVDSVPSWVGHNVKVVVQIGDYKGAEGMTNLNDPKQSVDETPRQIMPERASDEITVWLTELHERRKFRVKDLKEWQPPRNPFEKAKLMKQKMIAKKNRLQKAIEDKKLAAERYISKIQKERQLKAEARDAELAEQDRIKFEEQKAKKKAKAMARFKAGGGEVQKEGEEEEGEPMEPLSGKMLRGGEESLKKMKLAEVAKKNKKRGKSIGKMGGKSRKGKKNLFKGDKFRDFRTGQMDDDVRSRKGDKDKKPSSKALDKFGGYDAAPGINAGLVDFGTPVDVGAGWACIRDEDSEKLYFFTPAGATSFGPVDVGEGWGVTIDQANQRAYYYNAEGVTQFEKPENVT